MPNWEWRVFSPAASPSDNKVPGGLWPLIGAKFPNKEPDRTDVYLTCTAGAGLKLRNQREIEIKLRQEITSDGAEQWKKVVSTSLPRGVDTQNPVTLSEIFQRQLLRIQPKIEKAGLKQSLEEALAVLSTPQKLVTVTKSRVKQHVSGLGIDSVEEAIVSISMGGEAVTVWRSVCLEASSPDSINSVLLRAVNQDGASGKQSLKEYLCAGATLKAYPRFVIDRTLV